MNEEKNKIEKNNKFDNGKIEIPEVLKKSEFRFIRIKEKSKMPIDTKWSSENNFTYDSPVLLNHIEEGKNYGVLGGYGNLTIIDCDSEEIKREVEKLPETFTVRSGSGRGYHFYFICKDLEKPIRLTDSTAEKKEVGGLGDVMGYGKMVVGPTCIHPSGGRYEIIKNLPIAEVKQEDILRVLNAWIKKEFPQEKLNEYKSDNLIIKNCDITKVIDISKLRRRTEYEYYGPHPIHGSTTGVNFHCNVKENIWHCFRHNTGGGILQLIALKEGLMDCSDSVPGFLRGKLFIKTLKIAREKYGFDISVNTDYFTERGSFIPKALGDKLMEEYIFKTFNKKIYVYDGGKYVDGEDLVAREATKLLGSLTRRNHIQEVIFYIQTMTSCERDTMPLYLINVKNGILNIKTKEILPHDPKYFTLTQLPVIYDPNADCPNFKKFLSEVLYEEDIPHVQEMLGYLLWRDNFMQVAWACIGDGANGKSTFLNVINKFLGAENVSHVSLQDLSSNRFSASSLFSKLANIFNDIPSKSLPSTALFRSLTGGDPIQAEEKFRPSFTFVNTAKLIFSANQLPPATDQTRAFYRRWQFIIFPRTFTDENADRNILEKLTTPAELSGILNYALEGLERLLKNQKFTGSKSTDEIAVLYSRLSSPVSAFVQDELVQGTEEDFISKDDMFERFVKYCNKHKIPSCNKIVFGRTLPQYCPSAKTARRKILNSVTITGWSGVKFVENEDEDIRVEETSIKNFSNEDSV